ncbi:MAG: rod shape-determining protein MreC [Alphaproteobacteria bacterium]|nr:rod shape-determining protein MreC [Alphaproteobacteria bacterium]
MKDRSGSVLRLTQPVRLWVQRFTFLLLLAMAAGLMLLGKADTVIVERIRVEMTDAVAPVLDALSRPIGVANDLIEHGRNAYGLALENRTLREENARLMQWQAVARQLEAENAILRNLTGFVPEAAATEVSARVIGASGGAYVRSVLVAAGARHGVRKGQAAVAGAGLAGRVTEVGDRSARVLLITDLNSRIPVVVESSRDQAILAGDNSDRPRLDYLRPNARVSPGDRVVTSGIGGIFPPGIPVGVVVGADGGLRVQPPIDWDRLEFLRLVDFGLGGPLRGQGTAGDPGGRP